MSVTYDEILNSMKKAYFEEKGENVKNYSELDLRFKAVASEIYSVCAYNDFILKQGFPQTATGEYLERHAALRGLTRKKASCAKGTLTFSLSNAVSYKIRIPAGTVCSVDSRPFLQFATDESAEINANTKSVTVKATALRAGDDHNVPAGTVTVIVNPTANLKTVTNDAAFSGGGDDESDESLRERLLSSYSDPNSSLSISSARERLMTIDTVKDAYIYADTDSTLRVCLKTDGGTISSSVKNKVNELLGFASLCNVNIVINSAQELLICAVVDAKMKSGYDKTAVENAVKERLTAFCSGEKIGQNYSESAAAAACAGAQGVEYVSVCFTTNEGGVVSCGSEQYLKLEKIEVNVHEQ